MKVVHFDDQNWKTDHPTGQIAFHHLLKGDPSSPDNFMFVLVRQDRDFWMPRHRHNFDQIRFPIVGDMNYGEGLDVKEGQVGYFPEGLPYGPQNDPLGRAKPGERIHVTLQFGGASGYGFMSIEERRRALKELEKEGKFVGPHFHHASGKVEWGLNAVWRKVFGEDLKYPRSRYNDVIVADLRRFNWLPIPDSVEADHKFLGSYSERGVWTELVRLKGGAQWTPSNGEARLLGFVLSGEGIVSGQLIRHFSAFELDPGEPCTVTTTTGMELFVIGLPPVQLPTKVSDEFDLEEMPVVSHAAE